MNSKWLKKGDRILVITGNDKGKMGEILARKEDRVIVQGINIRKKHLRRRERTAAGEITSIERPIHISNVKLCDTDGLPLNLKSRITKEKKELYYIKNGKETIYRTLKKIK